MKRTKTIFVLNIIIIITMLGLIIWQLFFAEERSHKVLSKAIGIFIVYILAFMGIIKKRSPLDYILYEEQFRYVIGEAFKSDKSSYRKLMKAVTYFKREKPDKALKILDELKRSCLYAADFTAVLFFKGACYSQKKQYPEAIECCEEILERDRENAAVWTALGVAYFEEVRLSEAISAFKKALELEPENALLYGELAGCYTKSGETEKGLEYALKAIELDSTAIKAIGLAAVAYKLLGDSDNAVKYCEMFGKNGGDKKSLRIIIDNM